MKNKPTISSVACSMYFVVFVFLAAVLLSACANTVYRCETTDNELNCQEVFNTYFPELPFFTFSIALINEDETCSNSR